MTNGNQCDSCGQKVKETHTLYGHFINDNNRIKIEVCDNCYKKFIENKKEGE